MRIHEYYVYIVTNPGKTVLYTGVTNSLDARISAHYINKGKKRTFAGRYKCYNLIYIEFFQYVNDAIAREKQIKNMSREKKEALINHFNPDWNFLNEKYLTIWPPIKD
jgi:putative endonuclease